MVEPTLYGTSKLHHLMPPPGSSSSSSSAIKFLCSYGGKIIPRHPDGKLRYHGGETRVLAVDRAISFAELLVKLGELCGANVSLRCQLPKEDLDALVTVTSDEELANLIEEYDRAAASKVGLSSAPLKIRAFLSLPKKTVSPTSSSSSSSSSSSCSPNSSCYSHGVAHVGSSLRPIVRAPRCYHHMAKPVVAHPTVKKVPRPHYGHPGHYYLVHNGNHWQ